MAQRKRFPYAKYGIKSDYRHRPGAACVWLITFLTFSGVLSLSSGVSGQQAVPTTKDIGSIESPKLAKQLQSDSLKDTYEIPEPEIMPFAEPTSIELPTIGVRSDLIAVGKSADGTMEVPQKPNFDKAAWYRHSPAPGQYGASIIIGHVDSYANDNGASVFFNLAKLKLGDIVRVKRSDQISATFTVRAVRDYGKAGLPADIIYKPVTDSAELRLITCSGKFNRATQSYEGNTVIFATFQPPKIT